ncbi:MAG: UDP-2,3-diacylglucosamine diphosphatase, partial [Pseudomonadales bacterium]|nr:UDP-2,3-diacylglucosamine diphosphatase [Pseudomonadales bacterium]
MILLISDLHLEQQRPDITRAFVHFLQTRARQAEALYILGDFFEAWVGDDAMGPFQHEIASALRELADSGTRLYLMHGNRDFMLGQGFCQLAGCTLLSDPCRVSFNGEPVLLMHGDSLCTSDAAYMRMRRLLR